MRRILFVAAALVAAASGTHAQGSARAGGLELSFLRGGEFSARVAMDRSHRARRDALSALRRGL